MNKSTEIRAKLKQFKSLSEEQKFREFQFCLLTPQSNAQRCWQAVDEISKMKNPTLQEIKKVLSKKTRFHNTKAKRIAKSKDNWVRIKPLLSNKNTVGLRNELAKRVNGYGFKEASHFLRNIGLSNNQIAILDRHILRNLHSLGLIKDQQVKNKRDYLEKEQIFLAHAARIRMSADELDLHWWSQENGEIFK